MRLAAFTILFFSCFIFTIAHAGNLAKFPNTYDSVQSPDKRFKISDEDRENAPNHSLFLQDQRTGQRTKIMDFNRHADVSWAPSSAAFFVNDYAESNSTNCIIIDINGLNKIDILNILKQSKKNKPADFDGSHLYITCSSWNGGNKVVVALHGYDGSVPDGVDRKFLVNLFSKSVSIIR